MKNIVKNILITSVVLCGTGIVLYGAGNLLGGKEYVKAANLNRLDGTAMRGEPDGVKQMEKTKIQKQKKTYPGRMKCSHTQHQRKINKLSSIRCGAIPV